MTGGGLVPVLGRWRFRWVSTMCIGSIPIGRGQAQGPLIRPTPLLVPTRGSIGYAVGTVGGRAEDEGALCLSWGDGDSVGFPRGALGATQRDEDKHKAPSSATHHS